LSIEELRQINLTVSELSGNDRDWPVIDVDASWIGYHLGNRGSRLIGQVIHAAKLLSSKGFKVNLIADGPFQHRSKLASVKRSSDREKARIKYLVGRHQLADLVCRIMEENIGQDRYFAIQDEIKQLETSIKKSEFQSTKIVGLDFEE